MKKNWRVSRILQPKLVSLAVASCFTACTALANPTGPNVVHGTAAILQNGNLLQITNSPNAIINWQSFSVGASEITRFLQQSASSAVLNRVITQNPSSILGALQSNGRVFLINPNGILFGAGAQIDVAGLVASTLNFSNADFLAGRLKFTEVPGAGSVVNQGNITAGAGGQVYLVGPSVTNSGVITTPKGEVILAAGNSVELVNPGTPNLRVEITAPDNKAVNLGQIVADSGRVGIYAGLINHSGTIRANSAQVTEDGRIVLKATKNASLEPGSVTTASGPAGGKIEIQSGDTTLVAGTVEAKGTEAQGGTVHVLGNLVGLIDYASINASGVTGGGTVLVGGDFQGKPALSAVEGNPIQNASRTYVGPDATIKADAIANGDGGKVIVWSDDITRFYGSISARGGTQSGDGGFVEVSGKNNLAFNGKVDVAAPRGNAGSVLLDPNSITIVAVGANDGLVGDGTIVFDDPNTSNVYTFSASALKAVTGTLSLLADGTINVNAELDLVNQTSSKTVSFTAGGALDIQAAIKTYGAGLVLTAGSTTGSLSPSQGSPPLIVDAPLETGGGDISLRNFSTGGGGVFLGGVSKLDAGNGTVRIFSRSGTVFQDQLSAGIYAGALAVETSQSPQVVNLFGPNHVGTLAASVGGNLLFKHGGPDVLTIGSVPGAGAPFPAISGIHGANIDLESSTGAINVASSISHTGYLKIFAPNTPGISVIGSGNAPTSISGSGRQTFITRDLAVRGASIATSGEQSFNLSGGLIVQSTGVGFDDTKPASITAGTGQTILAKYVEVRADGAGEAVIRTTGAGTQSINTFGANLAGEGILVANNRAGSREASILSAGAQTIEVHNADFVRVTAPLGNAAIQSDGVQNITVQGPFQNRIEVGTTTDSFAPALIGNGQTITAGSLAVTGNGFVLSSGGNQIISTVGMLTLTGGFNPFNTQIANNGTGTQTITAGGIAINGGNGTNAQAFIRNGESAGTQSISVGPGGIRVSGGDVGNGNQASINQLSASASQTIMVGGNITIAGGNGGMNNSAFIGSSGSQSITVVGGFTPVPNGNIDIAGGNSGTNNTASIGSSGLQTITARSIRLSGGGGTNNQANISGSSGQNISTNGPGGIVMTGGAGSGGGNQVAIRNFNFGTAAAQNITVGAGQSLTVTGGTVGTGNGAFIDNRGTTQDVTVGGAFNVKGGASGTNNAARVTNQGTGLQHIVANSARLLGGDGTGNAAAFSSTGASQTVNIGSGGLSLTGGGGTSGNGATIGVNTFPATNGGGGGTLTIQVGGDTTLTGGGGSTNSFAGIGPVGTGTGQTFTLNFTGIGNLTLNGGSVSSASMGVPSGAQTNATADISINASSITLNPSASAGTFIGHGMNNPGPGNITMTATGGGIALNTNGTFGGNIRTLGNLELQATATGGQITQGASSVILANTLTTTSNAGTILVGGANNVGSFAAANTTSGDITLNNLGNTGTLTLETVSQNANAGNLTIHTGGGVTVMPSAAATASSLVSATGDITITSPGSLVIRGSDTAPGLFARLSAGGTLDVSATNVSLQGGNAQNAVAEMRGGPVNMTIGNELTLMGGSGIGARSLLFSNADFNLSVGGAVRLDAGTGSGAWSKVQTSSNKSIINLFFPNLPSGGYFVNGVEGQISQRSTGFFAGNKPAKPGTTFITDYGP